MAVALAILVLVPVVAVAEPLSPWDKQMNAQGRFQVLPAFQNAAVLDKETGLVWEQSPDTGTRDWGSARTFCANKNVGGRKGWRLPSVPELASLVDPNATSAPFLPAGHPFTNIQSAFYWSATTDAGDPPDAWTVNFLNGEVDDDNSKSNRHYVWCVRGDMNADQY